MLMATLERAIEIAVQAHRGQTQRNGLPYVLHPLKLCLDVATTPERIVAVLHDVVEDSAVTLEDLRKEGFTEEIIAALDLLTHRKEVPYEDYVEKIAGNPLARTVKLADLRHNMDLTRVTSLGPSDSARFEKYHRAWVRLSRIE
jgi:(p)ppGpp synthase/HD superfamily hydrolase